MRRGKKSKTPSVSFSGAPDSPLSPRRARIRGLWQRALTTSQVGFYWQKTVEGNTGTLAALPTLPPAAPAPAPPGKLHAGSRANSAASSCGSIAPALPLSRGPSDDNMPRERSRRATDPAAQLYDAGKRDFDGRAFAKAQVHFELCTDTLERRAARAGDPFRREATGYRHLDEFVENCRIMLAREARLAEVARREELRELRLSAASSSDGRSGRRTGGEADDSFAPSTDGPLDAPAELQRVCVTRNTSSSSSSTVAPPLSPLIPTARELLVFVCSPGHCPCPKADDEATEVSQHCAAAIRRGGTAADLQRCLIERATRRFLFIGHADTAGVSDQRTLCFTSEGGGVKTCCNHDLAAMFGAASPAAGGGLELVFLNGCRSAELGRAVHAAGVPFVVCWRSRTADDAARRFSVSFFNAYRYHNDYRRAFQQAKLEVATLPKKSACRLPKYALTDPDAPAADVAHLPPSRRPSIPAGVPVLLCAGADGGAAEIL
jgi:hypothetical protein